jgi:hypothetical protein
MKLYTLDLGYYGSITLVDVSVENAYNRMLSTHPVAVDREITDVQEHEINTDFCVSNLGDY